MSDEFVPEADAAEQHHDVEPDDETPVRVPGEDANEADALEQAQVVPDEEEAYEAE